MTNLTVTFTTAIPDTVTGSPIVALTACSMTNIGAIVGGGVGGWYIFAFLFLSFLV